MSNSACLPVYCRHSPNTNTTLEDSILFNIDLETFVECNFTLREIVVTSLMSQGFQQKEIAIQQNVSREYISRVVRSLRSKFRSFISRYNI